jgi:hypothetical protein
MLKWIIDLIFRRGRMERRRKDLARNARRKGVGGVKFHKSDFAWKRRKRAKRMRGRK